MASQHYRSRSRRRGGDMLGWAIAAGALMVRQSILAGRLASLGSSVGAAARPGARRV